MTVLNKLIKLTNVHNRNLLNKIMLTPYLNNISLKANDSNGFDIDELFQIYFPRKIFTGL